MKHQSPRDTNTRALLIKSGAIIPNPQAPSPKHHDNSEAMTNRRKECHAKKLVETTGKAWK